MSDTTLFVSTVVAKDDKLLVVQEGKNNYGQLDTWNFPAGRVEPGESLVDAAVREAKEESGYTVAIDGVLSVLLKNTDSGMSLVVFFLGHTADDFPVAHEEGIQQVDFVTLEALEKLNLRFPDDMIELARRALSGKSYPLDIIMDYQEA
ncbi:MAG: NUDIX domain-containing protein [Candidatus Saccharibacteria bacterium]|nr:NUDIX domain-containing protein [Candidatus Saccharibacteria bacterium]